MLTAVIVDDEQNGITVLTQLLKDFTNTPVKVVGIANNLINGVEVIKATKPDIVFMDIDMPGQNGLEVYKYFEKPSFKVIFVTAYSQYAIEAIKKSATDYLLKPVNFIELREALSKVSKELGSDQQRSELEDKLNQLCAAEMEGKSIVLDIDGGFILENTKNIEYCYADESYSGIVTYLGKEIVVSKSLKDLQAMLPVNHFYRTHRSFLVNIYYVKKFVHARESYVLMRSGTKIPVSVRTSSVIANDIKQMLSN